MEKKEVQSFVEEVLTSIVNGKSDAETCVMSKDATSKVTFDIESVNFDISITDSNNHNDGIVNFNVIVKKNEE